MLEIKNLSKKYGDNQVLNDINLSLRAGDLVHIKGINGSGKTTLFKIIAGIEEAERGEVSLTSNEYIGALIENPGFIENESAQSNLKFLAGLRKNYDENIIQKLFKKLNLDYGNRKNIKSYSLGMRQKVGIIQAVMENQDLVLLDEPTRGLDEKSILSFEKLIAELIEMGKIIVIASHDLSTGLMFNQNYELIGGELKLL